MPILCFLSEYKTPTVNIFLLIKFNEYTNNKNITETILQSSTFFRFLADFDFEPDRFNMGPDAEGDVAPDWAIGDGVVGVDGGV